MPILLLRILLLLLLAAAPIAADNPVQALVDDALAGGADEIRLPAGEIRADSRIYVDGASDLTIRGQQTTLVFTDYRDVGIMLRKCARVTISDLTIDCDPLPFTQGTIIRLSDGHSEWEFEVHDGYPLLNDDYLANHTYVYGADGRLKRYVPDIYPRSVEALSERRGRIVVSPETPQLDRVEVGDRIVLNIRSRSAVSLHQCEDITVRDVTVLANPGIAFLGRYMRGANVFEGLRITPGPPPEGATEPRLMSACADGLNVAYATRGPIIRDCEFERQGDDSINLHGATFAVCEAGESGIVLGRPYGGEPFDWLLQDGGTVRVLREGTFEVTGEAAIGSIEMIRDPEDGWRQTVEAVWPKRMAGGSYFRLTLESASGLAPGDLVDIPETACPGFTIRDCHFHDHRARGMRIMASNGVIEDNVIKRVQGAGISVGAEYGFWREAGWVDDVGIRRNRVEGALLGANSWFSSAYTLGAICIFARPEPDGECAMGNRGIIIEKNRIRDCPLAGIFISCARDVFLGGNVTAHTNYADAPDAGSRYGLSVDGPISVCRAEDVKLAGNGSSRVGETPPDHAAP